MIPRAAAVFVGHVSSTMAHELALDTVVNARQSRIVFEGMAERVKHHSPVFDATNLAAINAPMLTPFGCQSAIFVGT